MKKSEVENLNKKVKQLQSVASRGENRDDRLQENEKRTVFVENIPPEASESDCDKLFFAATENVAKLCNPYKQHNTKAKKH